MAKKKRYGKEFKLGAARLVVEQGYPQADVDREEKVLVKMDECKSNDPHVIALARVSGARVLCISDRKLEDDFKNRKLVPAPKGKIYKNANHRRLLSHSKGCVGRPR